MRNFTESTVEKASLELLEGLGYTPLNASDTAPDSPNPERQTYADVILINRLRFALATINPNIPSDAIEDTIKKITRTDTPTFLKTTAASTNSLPMALMSNIKQTDVPSTTKSG